MWVVIVQDKEIASGGTAPRMLCLDDYFVVEVEKVVTDPETGKKVKRMVIVLKLLFINNSQVVGRQCFRSATQQLMVVPRHRLSTVGRRALTVHGSMIWNSAGRPPHTAEL